MNKSAALQFTSRMARLEGQGDGREGWSPSAARLARGQDVFDGRVTEGPQVGHDVVVRAFVDAPRWRDHLLGRERRQELALGDRCP
jgi:hypothetical protein